MAENKAKDVAASMGSLITELQKEKQLSSSAVDLAKNASKESAAIKRAIQSLGCKVHFSSTGDCTFDVGGTSPETQQKYAISPQRSSNSNVQWEENSDVSVSISITAADTNPNNPIGRPCESLCPLSTRDGGCKWPDAVCAQLGSQLVGLKANFDTFDQLSIYDCYFGT